MINDDKISAFINTHPRESLKLFVVGVFLIWQSMIAVLGLALYFLSIRPFRLQWWIVLMVGLIVLLLAVYVQQPSIFSHGNFIILVKDIFKSNVIFWKLLLSKNAGHAFNYLYWNELNYLAGFAFFAAGVLRTIDLIPRSPHEKTISELQKGIHNDESGEVSHKVLNKALRKLKEESYDGTVLGVSKYTGKYSVIADRDINQVVLVLGTTGAGKTITLRRFYQRAIMKGYPLIVVDGKPENDNIDWLIKLAEQYGRPFFGFNCGNNLSYDPLSNGGYTELKDKIISLKDEWSSDHYRSIAEDYLQATFEVLLKSERNFDLKMVVDCLNYDKLEELAQETEDQRLIKRIYSLENYDRSDITGLQAHLNILIHSELGQFFEKNATTFILSEVFSKCGVAYFSLPALRFPTFSKVLGKLVINDLKAEIDRSCNNNRIFTIFDEFSVFAGEQVLNLVNMGRGKGLHAIFGTQGVADLNKVDVNFKNQILNCVNTLICHRLNDQESAESIANWIGTQNVFTVTAQINSKENNIGLGSVRRNKEFIVHPDAIKQALQAGEAFYISKIGEFCRDKVRVKFT